MTWSYVRISDEGWLGPVGLLVIGLSNKSSSYHVGCERIRFS